MRLIVRYFKMGYLFVNTIAWILSVIFAFVTNKIFVFNSKSTDKKVLLKETVFFFNRSFDFPRI